MGSVDFNRPRAFMQFERAFRHEELRARAPKLHFCSASSFDDHGLTIIRACADDGACAPKVYRVLSMHGPNAPFAFAILDVDNEKFGAMLDILEATWRPCDHEGCSARTQAPSTTCCVHDRARWTDWEDVPVRIFAAEPHDVPQSDPDVSYAKFQRVMDARGTILASLRQSTPGEHTEEELLRRECERQAGVPCPQCINGRMVR